MEYGYDIINIYSSDEEQIRRPKIIRQRPNFLEEYDELDFFTRFRLSKRTIENLVEELHEILEYPTNRNDRLSVLNQLLLILRYYATGSFLSVAGDFCCVSKSTACKTVRRISIALANLRRIYIKMQETPEEIIECKRDIYNIARFPQCIGAIDCTHVKILSPGGNNAELFRNRKQFFSFNVQSVADANLKIRDIVTTWPGSAHDSRIFRNSVLCTRLEEHQFGNNSFIIGDKGCPIKSYLITPLHETRNRAEELFNESIIRTRNIVERCYGVWKRRFPALATGIRLKLDTAQAVIVATTVLHNIACSNNEADPAINEQEELIR